MQERLSDYISVSHVRYKSGEVAGALGKWLRLNTPFSRWKEPVRGRWARLARAVFSSKDEDGDGEADDSYQQSVGLGVQGEKICLCCDVKNCPMKPESEINPLCPQFAFGVCVEATSNANEGKPLSFSTIGYLTGISKQRVEQIYGAAQKKLIAEIRKDPALVEFCTSYGIGGGTGQNDA